MVREEAALTSRREILAYVDRADEEPDLESAVELVSVMGRQAPLRAHARKGARAYPPPALSCDASEVMALVAAGLLAERRSWVRVTVLGKDDLRQASDVPGRGERHGGW